MFKARLIFAAPILAALAFSASAQAHTRLISSEPAADATVTKPGKIVLNFNEKLMASFSGADLTMTTMPGMAMAQPMKINYFTSAISYDGKTLTLLMKHALPAGTYTLKWYAAGADTHRVGGDFSFTVKQ